MNDEPAATSPPLAIVGMSCLFPQAPDIDSFWTNIRRGHDAIVEVPASHWSPDDYFDADPASPDRTYARRGGFLDSVAFDPLAFGISPNNLEAIDTAQLLGLVAAQRALHDAGYGDESRDRSRTGCILGVTGTLELVVPLGARLGHPLWKKALRDAGVADDVAADVMDRISDGYVPWQENSFPGLLGNVVAGRIANRLNLGGTNCVVDAACASSLSAMHLAALELATGRCDMVLTGGIDTFNDIFMYMCFSKTPALSPTGDARPFSEAADGTILGEGVGVLALKRLADAERDGDRIHAVVRGIGTSSDGGGNAVYAPKADGQVRCLSDAYRVAGVSPQSVDLFEAHGTGTKVGDATELEGLSQLLADGRGPRSHAIGSVKSQIGHTKAAAGVAGVIKGVLALKHGVLPPTIKVERPAAKIADDASPLYVNSLARPWITEDGRPRRAGISAFGFGGSNFHCVLEEAPQAMSRPSWDGSVQWLAFSAESTAELNSRIDEFEVPKDWRTLRVAAARLRTDYNPQARCRLHLVVDRFGPDVSEVLKEATALLRSRPDAARWQTPGGAYFGSGPADGQVAFLFPGQGSQRPQMLRDPACVFPAFRRILAEADEIFAEHEDAPARLSEMIFPPPAFTDAQRATQEESLRATQIAQPALAAVSLGTLSILSHFGLQADVFAGHSFGELTALCAGRRFAPADLYRLSKLRGRLMASVNGHQGGMLALGATPELVEDILRSQGLDLVIANRNSPNQVVLSGRLEEIAKAEDAFAAQSVRGKRLAVSAAFHSPLVAPAGERFRQALEQVEFAAAESPVYANTIADAYPDDPAAARDLLARQLAQPVNFVDEIRRMYERGVRTFVEVGPGTVLSGLVRSILGDHPHKACAIDGSNGARDGLYDLACTLAELSAAGHLLDVARWDADGRNSLFPDELAQDRLRIPICGANYSKPKPSRPPRVATASVVEASVSPVAPTAVASPVPTGERRTPAPVAPPTRRTEPQPTLAPASAGQPVARPAPPPVSAAMPTVVSESTIKPSPMPPVPSSRRSSASIERHLLSLQKMQQQTAELHRQFLENQHSAIQALAALAGHGGVAPRESDPVGISETVAREVQTSSHTPQKPLATLPKPAGVNAASAPSAAQRMPEPPRATIPPPSSHGFEHAPPQPLSAAEPTPAPPPSAQPPSAQPSAVEQPVAQANGELTKVLLEVTAEKTGYPAEMLKLSMSLDRDLGIDSIKRVEILSALQDRLPQLPQVQPEQLGTLHSLEDVCRLLAESVGDQSAAPPVAATESPAAQAAAETPIVAATADAAAADELTQVLLEVTAEKTGYPAEMLKLSMSLDRDLGIDSIKRVEILSALQDRLPQLPQVQPEQLGTLHSLEDVCRLLSASVATANPAPIVATPAAPASTAPSASAAAADELTQVLLEVTAEKTGYPAEMLKLSMSLDRDLGIDSIKRVEILSALQDRLPQLPHVQPEQLGTLHSLQDVQELLAGVAGAEPAATSVSAVAEESKPFSTPAAPAQETVVLGRPLPVVLDVNALPMSELPQGGVVRIVDDGTPLANGFADALRAAGVSCEAVGWGAVLQHPLPDRAAALVLFAPQATTDATLRDACFAAQQLKTSLDAASVHGTPAFMTVSRLDGGFGLREQGLIVDPLSGGLCGLAKTARHEWPQIQCTAVDVESALWEQEETGRRLADLLRRKAPAEVGLCDGATVEIRTVQLEAAHPDRAGSSGPASALPLTDGDTVIVKGGARGVTAASIIALARRCSAHFIILGRSGFPAAEPHWLDGLNDPAEMKRAILAHGGAALSPRELDEQFRRRLADREMRATFSAIVDAGATVTYRQVDVSDPAAAGEAIRSIIAEFGPVHGIVHGAGVLADALIEAKTTAQFDAVYHTKVTGFRAMLDVVDPGTLKVLVGFSSFTARYGRTGQVDYAIANEVLNKLCDDWSRRHPQCRVVSFNWGPWSGGMVTPELSRLFAAEGVPLIPLAAGAETVPDELTYHAGRTAEVVVLGSSASVSNYLAAPGSVTPATIPLPLNGTPHASTVKQSPAPQPATTTATNHQAASNLKTVFSRKVSLNRMPILDAHVLDGKAVVPLAMMIEWMGQAALHRNPDLQLAALEDVRVFQGIRVDADEDLTVRLAGGRPTKTGDDYRVPVRIVSGEESHPAVHAGATARLGDRLPIAVASGKPACDSAPELGLPADLYEQWLFHGPDLQGIEQIAACDEQGLIAAVSVAPPPAQWTVDPLRGRWLFDPLVLDSVFQLMIVWTRKHLGRPSLPTAIRSLRTFGNWPTEGRVVVEITITERSSGTVKADIRCLKPDGTPMALLDGYECVVDAGLERAFGNRQLISGPAAEPA